MQATWGLVYLLSPSSAHAGAITSGVMQSIYILEKLQVDIANVHGAFGLNFEVYQTLSQFVVSCA